VAIPLLDLDALAKACVEGDLERFAAAGAVGFALTEETRTALLRAIDNTNAHRWYEFGVCAFTVAQAIGLMAEAASNPSGIAITEQVRSLRLGKEIAIAFRHEGRVHFGVRYASNLPMTPSHLWSELKPWYKAVERNRARLEQWKDSEGIVSVPLVGRRPTSERSGAELLAAVVAEPDEPSHRLVYADWLIAQGDAQGELIQLCEARRAHGTSDESMDARIEQLQKAYGERIAGEIAQLADGYMLYRGFVTHIQMAAPTFAKHGERLLASAPIEELELKPVNAQSLARLARAPALRKLRGLKIGQIIGHTRPMPFDDLCASEYFESLRSLEVWTWETEGKPKSAFAELEAPRLERLFLWQVDSSPAILAGLARNESLQLRELEVEVNLRERSKWSSAFGARTYERLQKLKVDCGGREVGKLFERASLPELRVLEVGHDFPLELLRFPELRRLGLDGGTFEPGWLPKLLERLPKLELLRVWSLDERDVRATLEDALRLPSDTTLRGLELPKGEADPELMARVEERFGKSYWAFEDDELDP
jgi:uncharacterized protein (TIGR02996 family)